MSNLYPSAREAFLTGSMSWTNDTIKASLVSSSYTYSASHSTVADLGSTVVATSDALTAKTATAGTADAADVTFSASSTSTIGGLVLFNESNELIAFIDSGFPISSSAGDSISIAWDNGANRIFTL